MKLQDYGYNTKITFIRYKPYVYDSVDLPQKMTQAQAEEYVRPIGDIVLYQLTQHGKILAQKQLMSSDELADHK